MKRLSLAIPVAGLLSVAGCTTPNTSARYTPAATNPAYKREANGLKIAVDPVFDNARSKDFFNTDALGAGILPIHVSVENTNSNASFLLQKKNFDFTAWSGSQTNLSASATNIRSDIGNAVGMVGVVGLSAPMIFAGTIAVGNAQAVQFNFVQAEFRDQTLSPGQRSGGFIYFQVKDGHRLGGGVLKATVPDLRSQKRTQFQIPITIEPSNKH